MGQSISKQSTANQSVSKLLSSKSEEEILEPTGVPFTVGEQTFYIFPMPDYLLMTLGEETSKIVGLLQTLAEARAQGEQNGFNIVDLLPLLPEIVKLLVPNATRIIAACLRMDPDKVADRLPFAKKLEALRLIVLQEDFPLIAKNFQALVTLFQEETPAQETQTMEAAPETVQTTG